LNEDLFLDTPNFSKELPPASLLNIYSTMVRIRRFEEIVGDLVEEGKILCPCHLYIGQEGIAAGVCAALTDDDWVFSTHRSHGHYIAKGGDIRSMMAELHGKETGCSGGHGGSMHIGAPHIGLPGSSAIVAGSISLAVGAGLAFKLQGKNNISVAFFGDGATNEGGFYESLNFSALYNLPVIFICENNLYSTHLSIDQCLANPNIVEIPKVFRIKSVRIEGNNVFDVYNSTRRGIQLIRDGKGPVFIEAMTYRWRGHVGPSDDIDKGLRSQAELEFWMKKCPIKHIEQTLMKKGILTNRVKNSIKENIEQEIREAIKYSDSSAYPDPSDKNRNCQVYRM
jgi:pyruvate dehydrogenase E1 component alpha subunit